MGSTELVDVAGMTLSVSSPGKVYFPEHGYTKLDLIRYYLSVEEPVMRQMRDRPVMLQRFPDGVGGTSFFQKRMPNNAPEWLTTMEVRTVNGTASNVLVIADLAHLVWAVNLGCIGFHSWPIRSTAPQWCDELRIDLDPGPGTSFAMAQEAAVETKRLLDDAGVVGFVKTSGSRGLHVYVRLEEGYDSMTVRRAAVAVARELERRRPDLLTAQWWKEQRGARIFVDYNQNAPHKTVFAPWSVRALPHATVSFPFPWEHLGIVHPLDLTIATVPDWVHRHGDAWATIDDHPQRLDAFLELAVADEAAGLPDAPWPPEYPKMAGEATRVAPSRAKRSDD